MFTPSADVTEDRRTRFDAILQFIAASEDLVKDEALIEFLSPTVRVSVS